MIGIPFAILAKSLRMDNKHELFTDGLTVYRSSGSFIVNYFTIYAKGDYTETVRTQEYTDKMDSRIFYDCTCLYTRHSREKVFRPQYYSGNNMCKHIITVQNFLKEEEFLNVE
jgi:hypothetical protein